MSILLLNIVSLFSSTSGLTSDSLAWQLRVSAELRPRFEFRDQYRLSANDTAGRQLWGTQRNRLNIDFQSRKLTVLTSIQEIHLFHIHGKAQQTGHISFNELYLEPRLARHILLRAGRQNFQLDNGRMFSAAPWSQQSRSHEGLRLIYKSPALETGLAGFFTRKYNDRFDPAYSPVASHKYHYLLVYHGLIRKNNWSYTWIGSGESFDQTSFDNMRFSYGGRVELNSLPWYGTLSGFLQAGENRSGQRVKAYYLQPEIAYNVQQTTFRLGTEILSGTRPDGAASGISGSYEIPYGVAWKFMGNMNFYARFPEDLAGKGLINPYFFVTIRTSKKLSLRLDNHLFYSQYSLSKPGSIPARNLGQETDFSFVFKPSEWLAFTGGFSFYFPTVSTLLLNKVTSVSSTPVWTYLSLNFNPNLFQINKINYD